MKTQNDILGLLPSNLNLSSLIYALIIDTIVYAIAVWSIIYIAQKYDATYIRKPAITIYTILGLFFISILKFLIMSLAFIGMVYLICNV